MDGSEVTVVVLGQKGVGKSSFIHHCFVDPLGPAGISQYAKVPICGREISIRIIDNPGRQQLVPATMVILLFDLTQKESFKGLQQLLEVAQRVSPVALRAVVGTKADLLDSREVSTEEALSFCQKNSGNAVPLPYYETSTKFCDSILLAFQEIMARPLINDYVIKTTTEHEQNIFVQEVMEWAISSNSANILTHLRDMGYPIPQDIIEKYPLIIRDYLLGEYPLLEVARFKCVELKDPNEVTASWEDSALYDSTEETVLTIQDTRPNIQVTRTYHLMWSDISLPLFLTCFLDEEAMSIRRLTHVDLSKNKLTSIPLHFFQLPLLESLDLSHNKLTALPPPETWYRDSPLQYLDVSHNLLVTEPSTSSRPGLLVCRDLWYVDISHNLYSTFPHFLLHFSLRHLNISHTKITQLPPELSKMSGLQTLGLEGLSLVDPPSFVMEEGPEAILRYLQLKLRNKLNWSALRVVVVGPHLSGKSTLVSKITGVSSSGNKALEVVEWKYRGNEIFSFRNRWFTFDLWDFSGDSELNFLYASLRCQNSLHLVVCDATRGVHDLVRQLADLQSMSEERVIVCVVFTHMDQFRTREDKDKFRKTALQWLSHHNKLGGNGSFSLMATTSVRSLQGEDMMASYEADVPPEAVEMQEVKGPDIPLMPLVLRIHFISCSTGEGIPNIKKTLYKVASGSFQTQLNSFTHSTLVVREVPFLYTQLESTLRQLRISHHDNHQEGQYHIFHTLEELEERLKVPLAQLKVTSADFKSAITFIHKMGLIYMHRSTDGQILVCLTPQLIGSLLQRTLHACQMTQETHPGAIFLATTHLCMMWGVEPILTLDKKDVTKSPQVTSAHLVEFLQHLQIFSPLLPATMLVTPILPPTLPRSCDPDSTHLTPRRSYVFSFLPSFFYMHLVSRIVASIVTSSTPLSSPTSPNHPSPPPAVPIILPSGVELYLWQKNLFVCDGERCRVWVKVREVDVGLDPLPYCGRIDIHLKAADLTAEAHWLRLITTQVDMLLEEMYPGLLDANRPQKVEIFVPLTHKADNDVFTSTAQNNVAERTNTVDTEELVELENDTADTGDTADTTDTALTEVVAGQQTSNNSSSVTSNKSPDTSSRTSHPLTTPPNSGSKTTPPLATKRRETLPLNGNKTSPASLQRSGTAPSTTRNKTTPPSLTLPGISSTTSPFNKATPPSHTPSTSSSAGSSASSGQASSHGSSQGSGGFRKISNPSPSSVTSSRVARLSEHSWEVISKYSTTSNRLSVLQDRCDPDYSLVPLWECLQEAFKSPVVRVESNRLTLSQVIPDLLFADLPPELLFRSKVSPPDCYLMSLEEGFFGGVAPPPPEDSGMFIQSYFSPEHADVFVRKPGALKAFYLQSCLATLRKDLLKLQQLRNSHLVLPVGVQYCPPSLAVEAAPFSSLRSWMRRLRRKMSRVDTHHITLQLLKALDYFHSRGISYHHISSDSVLMWNLNPLVVKLAHNGVTHSSKSCELCCYLSALPPQHSIIQTYRFDYMLLGLLVFEMATSKQAFQDIYPLSTVALAVLHGKVQLNVEADHFLQKQGKEGCSEEDCYATGCQRLCLQSTLDHCLLADPVSHSELEARFSLCAGDHLWSPMRLLVNVEVMISSAQSEEVYWASGSRGLVMGMLTPSTGKLDYNLLQEAPPPESGLFANRRCKPVPIAVGRASGLALVQATNQLWVGTENGAMGSVYIFNLPNMRRHHHIHLQDAVLSLCAVNHQADNIDPSPDKEMRYRVLVGLANGTIILFLGIHGGKVLENPLQGPKIVIGTHQRRPCLTLTLTSEGHMWCNCGTNMEVYDIATLKLVRRLCSSHGAAGGSKGDVVTLMIVNASGVWTVGRRSSVLRLWDQKTGKYKASYDVADVLRSTDADITALAVKGGALWLGTRNGYLLILDSYLMEDDKYPLLGLQQCGQGKVKCIVPLTPLPTASSKLQVMCSLEFSDEVSCQLLTWEYFYTAGHKGSTPLDRQPKIRHGTLPDLQVTSATPPNPATPPIPVPNSNHSQLQYCKSF